MCRRTQSPHLSAGDLDNADNLEHPPNHDTIDIITYKKDQPVADPLLLPKPNNTFRIYAKNPNGLSVGTGGNLPIMLQDIQEAEVDCYLCPETKLDSQQDWVQKQLHNHCRQTFGRKWKIVLGSSKIASPTQHKPGGVLAMMTGNNVGRVYTTGADPFGRWTYIKTNGGQGRRITFIATYQVCQGSVRHAGPTTAITQQYSMLTQANRPDPHKIRHHHTADMVAFVKECQREGELVVVGGDFNETIGDDPGGLTRLCSECGLQDPVFERHGCTGFSTHIDGSRCIDYILMDPELMSSVEACGYEPYGTRIVSDHRGVYVDVNESLFFGNATVPPPTMNHRAYNSKNIKQTKSYFEHMKKHLEDHNWFNLIQDLKQCMANNTPNPALAENLDRRRIAACQYTENQMTIFPREPYSPELARLRQIHRYLKALVQCLAHPSDDWIDVITSHQSKLELLHVPIPAGLDECRTLLKEMTKALRSTEAAERKGAPTRRKFQEVKIAAYMDAGNEEAAKIIKKIQRAEASKAVFQQCASARGLTKEGGLSFVDVPVDPQADPKRCTNWERLVDPQQVEQAIRDRLRKHFSQSKNCNLTSPPFDITMDFDAACDRAEQILTGTYDTSQVDDLTAALLDCFAYALGTEPAVSPSMTSAELLGKIKVWDERTSTSPLTAVHLGHAKAYLAAHDLVPETPECIDLEQTRAAIIDGHVTILNYALQFQHSYTRWQSIVNAILEKDPGKPRIHRLRVIHLYEWDFNLLLCVKWRQLLHHVCDNDLINKACYGTMPGHSSLDPVFVRELEYEMARMTRRPLVHFDNDATSCYDRIPCFLANLASRKYGMNKKVCIVQAKTLQQAKYYLRTKLGISAEYAEHTQECPWFGTGQGSGNSPFYWLLISSTLYDLYCAKTGGGATYSTPDKQLTTTIHLLGFVDDVNNRTTLSPSVDSHQLSALIHQLIDQASQDSQLWHDILTTANQELELSKCKYHIIHYSFHASTGAPTIVDDPQPPSPLTILGRDGQPVAIQHIRSSEAIKYLGCHKCPSNQRQQLQALQRKCDDYARVINCSRLSRRGTQVFYQAIYRLSVGYPLPMCYFKQDELAKLQRKAHTAMLTHSGYNQKTALPVVFGPEHLGGADFFHLFDEQGYGQVSHFMKFWRTPQSHPGQLLRIAVAWSQYCAGTSWSIFKNTSTPLPHWESNWLKSMREYLHTIKADIDLDNACIPSLQREGDEFIMDVVLDSGNFKPAQIKMINYCRLYLRVITVADISNANGTAIEPGMYKGQPTAINVTSNWYHVHQARPGPRAWAVWKAACRIISTRNNQVLHRRLGNWIVPASKLHRQWHFWIDRHMDLLYRRRVDGTYTSHRKLHNDYDQEIAQANVDLPAVAVPVDVRSLPGTYAIIPTYCQWDVPVTPTPPTTHLLGDIHETLQPWEQPLFRGIELLVTQQQLLQTMAEHPVILCSDGSQNRNKASFGWVLSTGDGQRLVRCAGPSFGMNQTSYRAEGYGILAISRFLWHIQDKFQVRTPPGKVYCDNRSMIRRVRSPPKHLDRIYPNETLASEWDVLMEIWTTIQALDCETRPTFHHVKGHQDDHVPYDQLSLQAQLNVDADRLAESYIINHPHQDCSRAQLLPTAKLQLNLPAGTVTYNMKRTIRLARTEPPLAAKLKKDNDWSDRAFDDINWEASRRALRRLRKAKPQLVKYLNNVIPVGKLVSAYDPKYPASCPSCAEPIETRDHVWQCPAQSRVNWRASFLRNLRQKLEQLNTRIDLQELLLEGIKAKIEGRADHTINVPPTAQTIHEAQQEIGWDQILKGRMSSQWSTEQQHHLGRFDKQKNGMTWATDVIQLILESWLQVWDLRNGDRHGRDAQTKAQARRAQAIRELELAYEYKDLILAHHNWILGVPLDQKKNLTTHAIRMWLSSFVPILEESYKEQLNTG